MAYENRRFGDMFAAMGGKTPTIQNLTDKSEWTNDMSELVKLRQTSTIGKVIDHIKRTGRPILPDIIIKREQLLNRPPQDLNEQESSHRERLIKLRDVVYSEVIKLAEFINDKTPFATKHGVKGAEFENVLIVFGRGWNQYNFNQFLEWGDNSPIDKRAAFERNRNLFYVTCSRPKQRLALLFTQELSATALVTLNRWFGPNSVQTFNLK